MNGKGMQSSGLESGVKEKKQPQMTKRRSMKKDRKVGGKIRADGRVSSSSSIQSGRKKKMKETARRGQQRVVRCNGKGEKERLTEKGKLGSVKMRMEMSTSRREN